MTGGIGFSRMGSQSSKANRQMLKDVRGKHFKSTGTYKNVKAKNKKADPKVLKKIKEERLKAKKRYQWIMRIVLIGSLLLLGYFIYFMNTP